MNGDGFSTHQIKDVNGELRNALVHYREDTRHITVSVLEHESGTAMIGGAAALLKRFKKPRKADIFLNGNGPYPLPVGYYA